MGGRVEAEDPVRSGKGRGRELLELYWELGREICEKQKTANRGDGLIGQLSKDLPAAFPGVKGFSRRTGAGIGIDLC